jgi:hypothetical protein
MNNKVIPLFVALIISILANFIQAAGFSSFKAQVIEMGCAEYNSKNGVFQWIDRSK